MFLFWLTERSINCYRSILLRNMLTVLLFLVFTSLLYPGNRVFHLFSAAEIGLKNISCPSKVLFSNFLPLSFAWCCQSKLMSSFIATYLSPVHFRKSFCFSGNRPQISYKEDTSSLICSVKVSCIMGKHVMGLVLLGIYFLYGDYSGLFICLF